MFVFNTSESTAMSRFGPNPQKRLFEDRMRRYELLLNDVTAMRNNKNSIEIAVMGIIGSGKSSFINLVVGSKLVVSDSLSPCTERVQFGSVKAVDGRTVVMIDTPGSDHTHRSNMDIFMDISSFLLAQCNKLLHGIIYLHPVTHRGFDREALRVFDAFRELCGREFMCNVAVVTTMWDEVNEAEGRDAERRLRDDPSFKTAFNQGAKLFHHDGSAASAWKIIRAMLGQRSMELRVQRELVEYRQDFTQTAAARVLDISLSSKGRKRRGLARLFRRLFA